MTMNHNPNKRHTQSQKAEILEHLFTGSELTPMDALRYFGTMKLASRISEIRKECFIVQDRWITLENGKKVKSYKM
jgi:mRNA degradation ribonuclease J1/J2